MKKVLLLASGLLLAKCGATQTATLSGEEKAVEFKIADGTGKNSWNKKEDMLVLKVGQTLKIVNDDSIDHQMHTPGSPCPHGSLMKAKTGSYVCELKKTYDPEKSGALYDHNHGQKAEFWLKVTQ